MYIQFLHFFLTFRPVLAKSETIVDSRVPDYSRQPQSNKEIESWWGRHQTLTVTMIAHISRISIAPQLRLALRIFVGTLEVITPFSDMI